MRGRGLTVGVFRPAGVSYLRIPAKDPHRAAEFYRRLFGWAVDTMRPDPSFEDGTGHVIGHFVPGAEAAGEAGIRPYVYVDSVDETLERIVADGGEVVQPAYREGDLTVATFRDPEGNVMGVWTRGRPG